MDSQDNIKKVLIISYYWPPAGGPGVQRWLKFVKYLPDFGVKPIVYIPSNPSYPILDNGLLEELPQDITILKQKIKEPYFLAKLFSKKSTQKISSGIIPSSKSQNFVQKLLLWIRGNLFIPDARVLWVKPSVKYLSKYIKENNIQTVITTGPPHSLHLIGLALRSQLNIKWIADFRDPWTTIGYHKALRLSSYAKKKHKKMESQVLNAADLIIVTSPSTKTDFMQITSKPITVITNGYDIGKQDNTILDNSFSLAHIGSLLSDRNPKILWELLSELLQEEKDFKKHFQLKLIGKVSQEIIDTLKNYQLNDFVLNLGYVSHQEAIANQRKSQVLLLLEIDSTETKSIIPGKLFEYLVSGRPILAIGPKNSDFEAIISQTNTGIFCNYEEKQKLKATILEYYYQFLKQNLKVNANNVEQYSRKNLTKKLAELVR
jgi:glycosyltransferase involved in cell wall biosynthesis